MNQRILSVAGATLLLAGTSLAGVSFSNISFTGSATAVANPATLVSGATTTVLGNALTFATPNARVGIGASTGVTDGTITLQYDAKANAGFTISTIGWSVDTVIQGFLLGSGTLYFQEDVFELDSMGNEVNPSSPIGSVKRTWTSASSQSVWSNTIILSKQVPNVRVKKLFYLDASVDTPGLDRSVLGQVNQAVNVVPEPTSMAALGIGALALLRKRRKSAK